MSKIPIGRDEDNPRYSEIPKDTFEFKSSVQVVTEREPRRTNIYQAVRKITFFGDKKQKTVIGFSERSATLSKDEKFEQAFNMCFKQIPFSPKRAVQRDFAYIYFIDKETGNIMTVDDKP